MADDKLSQYVSKFYVKRIIEELGGIIFHIIFIRKIVLYYMA